MLLRQLFKYCILFSCIAFYSKTLCIRSHFMDRNSPLNQNANVIRYETFLNYLIEKIKSNENKVTQKDLEILAYLTSYFAEKIRKRTKSNTVYWYSRQGRSIQYDEG